MKAWLVGLIFVLTGSLALQAEAKPKSKSKSKAKKGAAGQGFRLTVHGGHSTQAFVIPSGANFDSIGQGYYAIAGQRNWSILTMGVQYFATMPANLRSFLLNSATEGKYKISFQRTQVTAGFRYRRLNFHLIYGIESSVWAGSPDLGLKKKQYSHIGAGVAVDIFSSARLRMPIVLTFLNHPARTYEFENYTVSTISAASGSEYAIGTGVAFEF